MIIRSQDKKAIVNLNNVDSICTEHNVCEFDVVCYNGLQESRLKIGAYSTEEKAINVLDMIQSAYVELNLNYPQYVANGYFEMPQDSEV